MPLAVNYCINTLSQTNSFYLSPNLAFWYKSCAIHSRLGYLYPQIVVIDQNVDIIHNMTLDMFHMIYFSTIDVKVYDLDK